MVNPSHDEGSTVAPALGGHANGSDADLVDRAIEVLHRNSIGGATAPSRKLYPHQWSWDSACVAIGYARSDQERAETELRSLFAGQWRNGLLPHIVFTEGARYFPGPEFWQTERSADAPARPRTSGIVQPAVHGTAVWEVFRHAADRERAAAFARELLPKVVACHEYLYRERTRDGGALVEVWHPWETGMDNSPLWDDALARIALEPGDVPEYRRVDVEIAVADERPSDRDYDRYAYLVAFFRDRDYDSARIREETLFALRPVLFNALLVQSNRDLAKLARAVGADPAPLDEWAERTAEGLEELWDEKTGVYRDFDVRAGEQLASWCSAGLSPLYAGVPGATRATRMLETFGASGLRVGSDGWAATSLPPADPRFDPTLYWRGPVWPILNWVLHRGLVRHGFDDLAEQLRTTVVALARDGGFWEHYDPLTRRGHGGEQFAWTAALVLDLVSSSSTNGSPDAPN
jgi:glycogen debranching enzyme